MMVYFFFFFWVQVFTMWGICYYSKWFVPKHIHTWFYGFVKNIKFIHHINDTEGDVFEENLHCHGEIPVPRSTCSEFSFSLLVVTMFPAPENNLSLATSDAGIPKYLAAKGARYGYVSFLVLHHNSTSLCLSSRGWSR